MITRGSWARSTSWSTASPRRRRTHPKTGEVFNVHAQAASAGATLRGHRHRQGSRSRKPCSEPATQEEIDNTVAVMGGEDWQMWIDALQDAGVLAEGAKTTAFTYLGEKITHDIYWNGSIGAAKKDLDQKVLAIRAKLAGAWRRRCARVGAEGRGHAGELGHSDDAAVPVAALQGDEGEGHARGLHRAGATACSARASTAARRTSTTKAACARTTRSSPPTVQARVVELWPQVTSENLHGTDRLRGLQEPEFLRLFGFGGRRRGLRGRCQPRCGHPGPRPSLETLRRDTPAHADPRQAALRHALRVDRRRAESGARWSSASTT